MLLPSDQVQRSIQLVKGVTPKNHSDEKLQAGHTFHLFLKLSLELRLLIWEQTWPEPRLIEAAICEDETTIEYEDVAILRFAGSLSTLLDVNFGTRIIEQGPAVSCPPPVSLYVCHESRKHTLKQYRLMKHTNAKAGSFYFNPRHDVLWFSFDFTDEPDYLRDLLRCYGKQLNDIESVLVEEAEWEELTPARYKSNYLSRLRGLKSITVLFRDDEDKDEDSVQDVDEENDGGEIANDEDNMELNNRHDCSEGLDTEVRKLQARADELKGEYVNLSRNQ
ncbi:548c8ca1-dcab-4d66-83db-05603e4b4183 [Sclerotinia trifoliorum]|uniref:548c8ca1-dcab-4d66-83db-05603e4b4183 n=1 Tax=Sclerotinia trifoliorum TaxID=28548 RepID=A0A8H2VYZ4_9HELO|nr:548c8ca1-dcab-4d66-83db-05603e4b4183 [Sclerotinia trifoliorum]